MKRFDSYTPAPELAAQPVVGARVFQFEGFPVAQIVLERKAKTIIQTFHPQDFGIQVPRGDEWHLFLSDDWVAAVRAHGDLCTLITFPGDRGEMRALLQSLSSK